MTTTVKRKRCPNGFKKNGDGCKKKNEIVFAKSVKQPKMSINQMFDLDKLSITHLCANPHDIAVQHVLLNICYDDKNITGWNLFCGNNNDLAVNYVINSVRPINYTLFSKNANVNAVKYLLSHPQYIDNNEFSANNNDLAVEYMLQHSQDINWWKFVGNKNTNAVNYMLAPNNINNTRSKFWWFCLNTHELAVDYIINNLEECKADINWYAINAFHTNTKMVQYLLQNPDKIYINHLSKNSNDLATAYVLDHINELDWFGWTQFNTNTNMMAVNYLRNNPHNIVSSIGTNPSIFDNDYILK